MNETKTTTAVNLLENGMPDRTLIDINDAAINLRKSKPTVYRWVKAGIIPCYKIGKNLFFYKDELLAYIYKCKIFTPLN